MEVPYFFSDMKKPEFCSDFLGVICPDYNGTLMSYSSSISLSMSLGSVAHEVARRMVTLSPRGGSHSP